MRRRLFYVGCIVIGLGVLMVAAGCLRRTTTAPTPQAVTTPRPSVIVWRGCDDGMECASLPVPLDAAQPDGSKIVLALIRLPAASATKRIGSLVVNPGGPGGSGVEFVRYGAQETFSQQIRDRFDIVGFDPRGVGASIPAVRCVDDPGAYLSGSKGGSDAEQRDLDRLADANFAKGCRERSGEILGYLSAPHVARDMEEIRKALGEAQLTFVGYSYGTLLGATYADLFPRSVRAFVLDGAIDPSLTPEEHGAVQDAGFDKALDAFLEGCADDDTCPFNNGGQTGKAFDDLFGKIEKQPLPAGGGRTVDIDAAWTAVSEALYSQSQWPRLAAALARAENDSNGSGLLELVDGYYDRDASGSYSNEFEASVAINCVDAPEHTTRTPATGTATATATPFTPTPGPTLGPASSPCDFWPVAPDRTPAAIVARDAPPILVIGTTGDPAAPYAEAEAMAAQLRSGRLLTYDGEGHTAYGGLHPCIDKIVDAYLIHLTIPAYGTVCSGE